jgi:hypothetical protein
MKFIENVWVKAGTICADEVANFAYLSSQVSFARLAEGGKLQCNICMNN